MIWQYEAGEPRSVGRRHAGSRGERDRCHAGDEVRERHVLERRRDVGGPARGVAPVGAIGEVEKDEHGDSLVRGLTQ